MFFLVDAVFYDMVPIGVVLLFHKYNYTVKLTRRALGPEESEELRSHSDFTDHEIFLIHKMKQPAKASDDATSSDRSCTASVNSIGGSKEEHKVGTERARP